MSLPRLLFAAASVAAALGSAAAAQVPPAIESELVKLGRVVAPAPTAVLYAPLQPKLGPELRFVRDVRYGPGPKETLDVAVAAGPARAKRRVVLFVHGGAFIGGDKHLNANGEDSPFYDNIMAWATAHGMVGVNLNYPLAPGATYPTVQEDIAAGIAWVQANIAQYGGDPQDIVLWGHSAGASHVAAYLSHPQFHRGGKPGVRAAVLQSGTYDLTTDADMPHVYFGPVAGLAERSAMAGLQKSGLRLFVIAAELDPPRMVAQAEALRKALCDQKRCPSFAVLKGHSHMSETYHLGTADQTLATPLLAFIKGD